MSAPDELPAADPKHRWPQTLLDMREVAAHTLRECAQPEADALAEAVVRAFAHYFGGREFYLPKGDKLDMAERDCKIYEDFNGRNLHELCTKYNLCDRQVSNIIAEQRELHRRKIQPSLF